MQVRRDLSALEALPSKRKKDLKKQKMDPKQHRDAIWFALAGPKSGEYLTSQQAQDCSSEKGAYEITPFGGEEGYYWKWVPNEEPVKEQDENKL